MIEIIPFGSGKGGVGKSILISNLGIELSKLGKTVILIDMDLGGSNLHTFLGKKNNKEGLGTYFTEKDKHLESLIQPTEWNRLFYIPGDNLLPETANHPFFMKKKFFKEIKEITADFILLDLGAGTAFNTIDYFLLNNRPAIVITPEPTSILNAYSLIKTSLFRLLYRSLPVKTEAREKIHNSSLKKMEGTEWNWEQIMEGFSYQFPELTSQIEELHRSFFPQIIINMGRERKDLSYAIPLRKMCKKLLAIDIRFTGFIHYEKDLYKSIQLRKPGVELFPDSPFQRDVKRLSEALCDPKIFPPTSMEDLEELHNFF